MIARATHTTLSRRARAGETLVETLAAVLVATLAIALLFSSAAVAHKLTHAADVAEAEMLEQRTYAELKDDYDGEGTITLTSPVGTSTTKDVIFYGPNPQGIMSYGRIG